MLQYNFLIKKYLAHLHYFYNRLKRGGSKIELPLFYCKNYCITLKYINMKKVCEYIKQNNLLEKGDRIILGVSGGADSVCLLYIMNELGSEYALNITAVHINHMIR